MKKTTAKYLGWSKIDTYIYNPRSSVGWTFIKTIVFLKMSSTLFRHSATMVVIETIQPIWSILMRTVGCFVGATRTFFPRCTLTATQIGVQQNTIDKYKFTPLKTRNIHKSANYSNANHNEMCFLLQYFNHHGSVYKRVRHFFAYAFQPFIKFLTNVWNNVNISHRIITN